MNRQAGFSLLEVLVAFTILAFSLGVLYQAFGHGLRNLSVSGQYDHALILAESLLDLTAAQVPLKESRIEGQDGLFRWQVVVSPYTTLAEPSRHFTPYRVEVTVSWTEGGRTRTHRLETLRLHRR